VHLTSRDALRIFDLADIWAARTGNDVRLVSANDHVHSRGSAHYDGAAVDFHSSDPDRLSVLFRQAGYRVLWKVPGHYAHVHVERQLPAGVRLDWPLASMGEASPEPRRRWTQRPARQAALRPSRGPRSGG
jgi:hypothetical protein